MGKRARLKKQAKIGKILEQKKQVEQRKVAARSPLIRFVRHFLLVLIITVALLYVGQAVNQKIAKAESKWEMSDYISSPTMTLKIESWKLKIPNSGGIR